MTNLLSNFLQFLVIIPAAILCYIPMKDKIKLSKTKFGIMLSILLIASVAFGTIVSSSVNVSTNIIFLPMLIVLFGFYHNSLKVNFGQSLAMFLLCMVLMSFPSCFSILYDAHVHPTETLSDICVEAPTAQLIFSFGFVIIFAPLLWKFGRKLINELTIPKVWYTLVPIFLAFLIANIFTMPMRYETLYVNRVFSIYVFLLLFELFVLMFVCIIFYFVSTQLLKSADESKQLQILRMQEQQYESQQKYMQETARMRHDFRQSVYTLRELVENKEYESLRTYIENYTQTLPENDVVSYCKNTAINALLNYYSQLEESNGIAKTWDISIPLEIGISEIEFCTLLGNILENSIDGTLTVEKEKRYHKLSITVEHNTSLYIVSVNSFDGNVNKKKGKYLSTHSDGHGIGVSSIAMTAEKYNGQANFKNTSNEFSVDVAIDIF